MENGNLAIIISASDKEELMKRIYGSVIPHAVHMGKYGKVFWQTGNPGKYVPDSFRCPDIKKGYIYVTSIQKVYYSFEVEFIKVFDDIENPEEYKKYVPEWRVTNWESQKKGNWGYWILINDIQELKRLYDFDEFDLYKTGEPLKAPPQTYSFIRDPEYEVV